MKATHKHKELLHQLYTKSFLSSIMWWSHSILALWLNSLFPSLLPFGNWFLVILTIMKSGRTSQEMKGRIYLLFLFVILFCLLLTQQKEWTQSFIYLAYNLLTLLGSVFFCISTAVKRQHDHSNSSKGNHLFEVAGYSSELQTIIIMVVYLEAGRQSWCCLCLDNKETRSRPSNWAWHVHMEDHILTCTVKYFLQQGHTYSNRTIPQNSATLMSLLPPHSNSWSPKAYDNTIILHGFCLISKVTTIYHSLHNV